LTAGASGYAADLDRRATRVRVRSGSPLAHGHGDELVGDGRQRAPGDVRDPT